MCSTNWVEVGVTILQSEVLQILQCHVRGCLHCLQVFLTVGSNKVDVVLYFRYLLSPHLQSYTKRRLSFWHQDWPVYQQNVCVRGLPDRYWYAAISQTIPDQSFMTHRETLGNLNLTRGTGDRKTHEAGLSVWILCCRFLHEVAYYTLLVFLFRTTCVSSFSCQYCCNLVSYILHISSILKNTCDRRS